MASKSGTKYGCLHCDEQLTVFVQLSEPPIHTCSRANKILPLFTFAELKEKKRLAGI